jgi:hypothetical protein
MTTLQKTQFSLLKTKENNKAISKEKSNFGKSSRWRRKTKDQVRGKNLCNCETSSVLENAPQY